MDEGSSQLPRRDETIEGPGQRSPRRDRLALAAVIIGLVIVVVIVAWVGTSTRDTPKSSAPVTASPRNSSVCLPPWDRPSGTTGPLATAGTPSPLPSPATALDVAERLPELQGSQPDRSPMEWSDPLTSTKPLRSPMLTEHLRSAASGEFAADRHVIPFGGGGFDITVELTVWVYDSPADRLAAEQANPPGEQDAPIYQDGQTIEHDLRCFADCGPIAVEVSLTSTDVSDKARAGFADALASSQAGLESIFGECPTSDDIASNPPTVGTWPDFVTPATRAPSTPSTQRPRLVCMSLQRGEVPKDRPVAPGQCLLNGVDLSGADLAGADLEWVSLHEANLSGANLVGTNLMFASLSGANLSGANLTGANLEDATMTEANLRNANLIEANLGNASLTGARLLGADLTGADLEHAMLTGANLSDANLTGASVLYAEFTFRGVIWSNTTCPDGTNSKASTPQTCLGHGM